MKIIIPMSGKGSRFVNAGYTTPKPLIVIDGKPIIEHVLNLFPGEHEHIFICNQEHIEQTNMKKILHNLAPNSNIITIPYTRKGPVYAVSKAFDLINDDDEVIVNYCDFGTYWDYNDFLLHTRRCEADGAIPAYKGFHPHMLGSTNYAFIKEQNQWLQAIKEKEPWTNNRMQEYASNGTYYFRKGSFVKKYFQQLMDLNIKLNGEYYVSLVYNLMQQDNLKTFIYEIQHMLQWGTPQDVEEYQKWSSYFSAAITPKKQLYLSNTLNLIPMAGRGKRFSDVGYTQPKPLIPVSGKPMIVQATQSLPTCNKYVFVCLKQHLQNYPAISTTLTQTFANTKVITTDQVTQGQACTAELGISQNNLNKPLLIGACDNGMLLNSKKLEQLLTNASVEAIAFSFRNHPASKRNPKMYGWVKVDKHDNVQAVSVKQPISNTPEHDHAIVGAFYFASTQLFLKATHYLYKHNIRINSEFYIDSCIDVLAKLGHTVKVFEVDHYICWGTPNDYKTFEYWQSFFHKCTWHPYSLEKDSTVPADAKVQLDKKYRTFTQPKTQKIYNQQAII